MQYRKYNFQQSLFCSIKIIWIISGLSCHVDYNNNDNNNNDNNNNNNQNNVDNFRFVLSHSEDTSALLRQMEELEMLRVGTQIIRMKMITMFMKDNDEGGQYVNNNNN